MRCVKFFSQFLYIDFRDRKGEREKAKHRFVVPLIYAFVCALTRDGNPNHGVQGRHCNQLYYPARAKTCKVLDHSYPILV